MEVMWERMTLDLASLHFFGTIVYLTLCESVALKTDRESFWAFPLDFFNSPLGREELMGLVGVHGILEGTS